MNIDKLKDTNLFSALLHVAPMKFFSLVAILISASIVYRYFGPEERGIIAIILAIIGIFQIFILETGQSVQTFTSKSIAGNNYHDVFDIIWSAYVLKFCWGIAIAILLYVLSEVISRFYVDIDDLHTILQTSSLLILTIFVPGPLDQNFLQSMKMYKEMKYLGILEGLSFLIITLITVLLNEDLSFYVSLYVSSKLFIAPYTWYLYKKVFKGKVYNKINLSFFMTSKIFNFSLPVWSAGVLYMLSGHVSVLLVGYFFEIVEVGYYALAFGIYSMTSSILQWPDGLALPKIIEYREKYNKNNNRTLLYTVKFWDLLFVLSILAAVGLVVFSELLVLVVGGEDYKDASYLVSVFGLVFIVRTLSLFRILFYAVEKTKYVLKYYVFKVVFEFGSMLFTITMFGIIGLPVSLFIGYLSYGVIVVLKSHKLLNGRALTLKKLHGVILEVVGVSAVIISVLVVKYFELTSAYYSILFAVSFMVIFLVYKIHKRKLLSRISYVFKS
jgi:O-antigen/teichoic acid export membrane protein